MQTDAGPLLTNGKHLADQSPATADRSASVQPQALVGPGTQEAPRLLLKPPEAARALAIGSRKLWQLTKDGAVRCVRIGRLVRYDVRDLQDYVDRQK